VKISDYNVWPENWKAENSCVMKLSECLNLSSVLLSLYFSLSILKNILFFFTAWQVKNFISYHPSLSTYMVIHSQVFGFQQWDSYIYIHITVGILLQKFRYQKMKPPYFGSEGVDHNTACMMEE
jgi:hypothetical protein